MRDHWLKEVTGVDDREWVARVQQLVSDYTVWDQDGGAHGTTDVLVWATDLANEVIATFPEDGVFDENIRYAEVMGLILVLWSSRVHYAKTQDPGRPIVLRKRSYAKLKRFWRALWDAVTDESRDDEYFPQLWDHPHQRKAKDGDFV